MADDEKPEQPIISGALRTSQEKWVIRKAAEEVDESLSTFVRRAALRRAVAVARSLPDPGEKEESHA